MPGHTNLETPSVGTVLAQNAFNIHQPEPAYDVWGTKNDEHGRPPSKFKFAKTLRPEQRLLLKKIWKEKKKGEEKPLPQKRPQVTAQLKDLIWQTERPQKKFARRKKKRRSMGCIHCG